MFEAANHFSCQKSDSVVLNILFFLLFIIILCYDKLYYGQIEGGPRILLISLMVLDSLIAIILIASVIFQSGKSSGMGGSISGGADTVFSGKARGMDALLSRVTIVFAILFAILTLIIAKMTA